MLCKCSGKYIDIYFNLKITCVSDSSPISKLPRQTTLNFTPSRVKSPQLPITRLAAAALPAGSWVDTPIHPQFIVCRRSERLSLTRLHIISLLPPSVFFSVSLVHRLGLLGYSTPSSALLTPATVDSATLRSCPQVGEG